MITSWRLFNFKSFRNDTTVPLGPLTVLAGANSSGKSTLLQSMLMVAQTLDSRVASRPVVLNGPLVRLGTVGDVRSYGSDGASVTVGFAVRTTTDIAVTCEVTFDSGREDTEAGRLHPQLVSCSITGEGMGGLSPSTTAWVRRADVTASERSRALGLALDDHTNPLLTHHLTVALAGMDGRPGDPIHFVGCRLEHFIPAVPYVLDPKDPTRIVSFEWADGLQRFREILPEQFSRVRYLGPLRDEPRALYPLSTTADTTDVGLRGEHTAAVYDLHRNDLIRYFPTVCFPTPGPSAPGINFDSRARTLESAVVEWLQYLGVVESLTTRDLGNLGHELKVTTAGVTTGHDLTHVGTGVSQVLPIVVMGLLAAPDTTLLIEQPELHLHPRVQTLLGDFFLALAMSGRQVIVETHSEYLINRLRYRIASAEGDQIARLVKTWFVEKDAQGASVFRAVEVNRFGAIPEWPKGFFDQSQREIEHILLAGATKKKAERTPGGR